MPEGSKGHVAKSFKYADVDTVVWKVRRQVAVNMSLEPSLETGREWNTKWVFKLQKRIYQAAYRQCG